MYIMVHAAAAAGAARPPARAEERSEVSAHRHPVPGRADVPLGHERGPRFSTARVDCHEPGSSAARPAA